MWPGVCSALDLQPADLEHVSPARSSRSTSVEPLGLQRVGQDLHAEALLVDAFSATWSWWWWVSSRCGDRHAVLLDRLEQRLGRAAGVDHARRAARLVGHEVGVRQPLGLHGALDDHRRRRSLVSGGVDRRPARRVPGARAGGLPERRHRRARAARARPTAARERARARSSSEGRGGKAHFERLLELGDALRERVAALLGCDAGEVALTGSTTDGVNAVLGGARPRAPATRCSRATRSTPACWRRWPSPRERRGFERARRAVRRARRRGRPGDPARRLLARVVGHRPGGRHRALAASGAPVLLDGAQGLGAVPVDVRALGCDFYAASGQKWLCGPTAAATSTCAASGSRSSPPPWPGYGTLADPAARSTPRSATARGASTRACASEPTGPGRWRRSTCWRRRAWTPCSSAAPALAAEARRAARGPRPARWRRAGRSHARLVGGGRPRGGGGAARRGGLRGAPPARARPVRASVGAWSNEDEMERLRGALLRGHDDDAEHHRRRPRRRTPSADQHAVGAAPRPRGRRGAGRSPGSPRGSRARRPP